MSTPRAQVTFEHKTFMDDRSARGREKARQMRENNPRTTTPETRDAVAQALRDGEPSRQIVAEHNVSPSTVSRIRRECGIPLPRLHGRRQTSKKLLDAITDRMQAITLPPPMEQRGAALRLAHAVRNGEPV